MLRRFLQFVRTRLGGGLPCHAGSRATPARKVVLFGAPNVGKSVIFNRLTGSHAVVSNYPGTTVEVSRGRAQVGDVPLDIVDSPGTYSLSPLSEDERVARDLLLDERPDLVLHVADAKNLARALPLTIQLAETGLPVVLDLNIMDEAARAGLEVDLDVLGRELGLPVRATSAADGTGMDSLRGRLAQSPPPPSGLAVRYPPFIEAALARLLPLLDGERPLSPRATALLILQRDAGIWERLGGSDDAQMAEIEEIVSEAEACSSQPPSFAIALARRAAADHTVRAAVVEKPRPLRPPFAEMLGRIAMHPVAGVVLLMAVLYFGLYLFVGRLGAGVLVDYLDRQVFERYLNPAATAIVARLVPSPLWSSLFIGEYGAITLGLRYAVAIVLPLIALFFLAFAVLEDSGYLPRMALLVDRILKHLGLTGRAVIPLVLGLGCSTMATLVTRVLQTRRERIIATFLLALAIPCSAQLGVILGLLSTHPVGLVIWVGVVLSVFALSGFLAARLVPGDASRFYLEIPPLRLPSLRNIAAKTFARIRWYAAEVIPLFMLASVVIWVGQVTHLFQLALSGIRPLVNLIGLPDTAADAFLFGFFRRDYGAARIFDVHAGGAIAGVPLVVAMVTITLFVPCVAQFLVMLRERGWRAALAVVAIILPFAFGVGFILNWILTRFEVQI